MNKINNVFENMVDFAGRSLDGEIVSQSLLDPVKKREINRRVNEINNCHTFMLYKACDIHPDDREKYINILAYMGF
jgi:hypothetical protein